MFENKTKKLPTSFVSLTPDPGPPCLRRKHFSKEALESSTTVAKATAKMKVKWVKRRKKLMKRTRRTRKKRRTKKKDEEVLDAAVLVEVQ
jgi:hypothetical protein